VIRSLSGNVLSIQLRQANPDAFCTQAVISFEAAFSLRELGFDPARLPSPLVVRVVDGAEAEFVRTPAFDFRARIEGGLWKPSESAVGALSIDREAGQIVFSVLGFRADQSAAWWLAASAFGAGSGRTELFTARSSERLDGGDDARQREVLVQGEFEFAAEGPGLIWAKYGGAGWRALRPWRFGVPELVISGPNASRASIVSPSGSWRAPRGGSLKTLVVGSPRELIEAGGTVLEFPVQQDGVDGSLFCDVRACRFNARFTPELGNRVIPIEGLTAAQMSVRTATGWQVIAER
jgi:hypothetical protein